MRGRNVRAFGREVVVHYALGWRPSGVDGAGVCGTKFAEFAAVCIGYRVA